jgi:hypothetical protein
MEGHRSTRIRIATNVLSALRHYREPNPEDLEYLRQFDPHPGERALSEDELACAVIQMELENRRDAGRGSPHLCSTSRSRSVTDY